MTMGARIRAARKAAKIKQVFVANKLGVSAQAVNNWEADKYQPSKENLLKLAELLNISVSVLLQPDILQETTDARTLGRSNGVDVEGRAVPMIERENILVADKHSVRKSTVYTSHPCGPGSFALRVWDKSHEPHMPLGTMIVYDPDPIIEPGDFVIASQGGQTISGVFSLSSSNDKNSIVITPLNGHWPPWVATPANPILVIGVKTERHLMG